MTASEVVTLKEYIETRMAALEKATCLAAEALERRLESMNEFREALKNQSGTFVTRSELDAVKDKYEGQLGSLLKSRDETAGKASQSSVNINLVLAIAALALAAIALFK